MNTGDAGRRLRMAGWLLFAAALAAAPWVWRSGFGQTMLTQMAIAVIACLACNILLGQGGMLSFGQAVYSGLGGYLAIHALNAAGAGALPLPVVLVPLAGGLAGLAAALVLGLVATRRAGLAFAMITLGIGELVAALSLMVPEFSGGEAGVSANRVVGPPVWGITFGPQRQVYCLAAVYCFIATAAMYALTRTPFGRMLNAVRDNAQRVAFLGYSARHIRLIAFALSGFFLGVAGGLSAVNLELVQAEVVSSARSGAYLLYVVLGGAGFFLGPVLGAVLMVLGLGVLSEWTKAWSLYLGLVFVLMVMYAPGGIASLVMAHLRLSGLRVLGRLGTAYLALGGALGAAVLGVAALVEMLYHLQLNEALGPQLRFMGVQLHADRPDAWAGAALLLLTGAGLFEPVRRVFRDDWEQAHAAAARRRATQHGEAGSATVQEAAAPACAAIPVQPPATTPPPAPAPAAAPALELVDVHKRFGRTEVIRGASLRVHGGERLALIGPNGAGKSTLFNLISGRFAPTRGAILLQGRPIQGLPPHTVHRRGLARSFQVSNLFVNLSAFENVRCAVLWHLRYRHAFWRGVDSLHDANARSREILEQIQLDRRRDVPAMHLTYAEQRALEIGMAIAGGAPVILLDEPTAGMSRTETRHFVDLIRRVTQGRTLLVVEHDMGVVFELADRIAVLVYGEVIACDSPAAIRADARVQAAYLGMPEAPE